jgi:hypothetical protein
MFFKRKKKYFFPKEMEHREFVSCGICYSATWDYLQYVESNDDDDEDKDEDDNEKDPKVIVTFYRNRIEIGKLGKNNYKTKKDKFMLLEWFEMDNQVVFLFNQDHGQIGIFNADTCVLLRSTKNNDAFITNYKMFDNNEYLYVRGSVLIWPIRFVYHIPTMLKNTELDPIYISCCESKNPGITLMGCATCKEFISQHEAIFEKIAKQNVTDKFNLNRTNDSILNRIVQDSSLSKSDPKAIALLKNIMSSNRFEYSESAIQNGNNKPSTHLHSLYTTISDYYCTDKTNSNQQLLNSVFYCRYGYRYEKFDTRFEIRTEIGNVRIDMKHDMLHYEVAENMKSCTGSYQINIDGKLDISCKMLE